jgi:hypothetical protein
MAESVNSFNEYVEEGTKLAMFKEIYSKFEEAGKEIKKIKGTVDSIKNLEFLDDLKDKFEANLSLDDKIAAKLKGLGLTDKALDMLSGFGFSADAMAMSLYGAAETFGKSILTDAVSFVSSKIYIPEDVFLLSIKGLAMAGTDPNSGNVLRNAILRHDLVETAKWLDNHNNASAYDLDSGRAQDALTAAKNGSFNVALYILRQLKKTYNEIKSSAAFTEKDEEKRESEAARYESFFNKVIKTILVCSYGNLTVDKFQGIAKEFPAFVPGCLGTEYSAHSKRAMVSGSDLDTLAPLKYYLSAGTLVGKNSGEVFIEPRNTNIKKIYVWLAFSSDFNESERLVNKPLHDRLKYKMLSTVEKAFYEGQDALIRSALGEFVQSTYQSYLSTIAVYVKKVEKFLFDPKKQDSLTASNASLPDFRPRAVSDGEGKGRAKTLKEALPVPQAFSKNNITYDDFEVYYVNPEFTNEKITKDALAIVQKSSLPYMLSKFIQALPPDVNSGQAAANQYFVFYNGRFGSNISEPDREEILDYVLAKYLVEYYGKNGCALETIAAMFPGLNNAGIFSLFRDYYALLNGGEAGTAGDYAGLNRPVNVIPFYREAMNSESEIVKIEETGINAYNVFGEKVHSFQAPQGTPVGISIIGQDSYILSLNRNSGQAEAYYSPDEGLTFLRMEGNANEAAVYPGVGITSVKQINFFKCIYYMDMLFIIRDGKLAFSRDRINFSGLTVRFESRDEMIAGASILPDGSLYLMTNYYIYMIENFNPADDPDFVLVRLAANDGGFNIIEDAVGTIINAVSVPLKTTDDFDIDDKDIIRKLLMYCRGSKVYYYWYSPESPAETGIFDGNIARLREKLAGTADPALRARLQKRIEKQEYFRGRIA